MSTGANQTEAVVLQTVPFKERDRILTLFSPHGLLKLFVSIRKKEYLHLVALTSPLTQAEWNFTLGRKELHRFSEGKILSQHLGLRERLETLTAAETLIQGVLASQMMGKPAPKLYALFTLFLDYLPLSADPQAVATIFLIKVLIHEGMLELPSEDFTVCYRYAGERYQAKDAPLGSLCFSAEEEKLLHHLALSRLWTELTLFKVDSSFQEKVLSLFKQTF